MGYALLVPRGVKTSPGAAGLAGALSWDLALGHGVGTGGVTPGRGYSGGLCAQTLVQDRKRLEVKCPLRDQLVRNVHHLMVKWVHNCTKIHLLRSPRFPHSFSLFPSLTYTRTSPPPFGTTPPSAPGVGGPIGGRPSVRGKSKYGGRPGQCVEEQGTWASQKHSEAGYGRPVDRGVWTAKTVKRPRQQPAHPQCANYCTPLTRKRHTMPHSAQPQHTNYWAP